ncbi:tail protein X [Neisseriaceae bacterium TC5R-5]|nr:tail protein X [Neisseriaceae bacterium TC5R-5]
MFLTHISTAGERWDQLAHRYYGDALQYERIIVANPHVPLGTHLAGGLMLSIPVIAAQDLEEALPPWLR